LYLITLQHIFKFYVDELYLIFLNFM